MTTKRKANPFATAMLATTLAASGALALAPAAAFAVPAGGYGDLVEAVSPSVVFIEVTAKPMAAADRSGQQARPGTPSNDPFEEFMRRFGQPMPEGRQMPPQHGLGSGFIVSTDGLIVTNNHVVQDAAEVSVKLADGTRYDATVIGTDPMTDLALIKINADKPLQALTWGASATMRPGDEVVAVGNPFGLGGTVTSGIVSAMSRDINSGPFDDFIQTDAAINRGNSGGPLFNNAGEVIGVNTAIYSPDGGSVGIGFAVPSDMVQKVVADLADDGTIQRGWLGVQIKPMSDEIANVLGYETPRGAVIEAVTDGSPADKAGLQKDDIILTFNGTEITELRDLPRAVADTSPTTETSLTVLRKGKEVTLDLTVGDMSAQEA
ncbi:Do family serine endopeptidase [Puniceibacterium sp. IMCC21224]|uniref:Do family serine endopeptidase n=1 Tax=Puniceibacterium sp. IMCC21224 TaxID=1618204 RepID=UPI00064DF509|nr:Do family serine endopeptidase [Puniceibacterium sp. IMCC21224]KMK67448.1 periplasmic serine protease, Do/DeqQ family [Puniceibacterium sp. IMCC21224]